MICRENTSAEAVADILSRELSLQNDQPEPEEDDDQINTEYVNDR